MRDVADPGADVHHLHALGEAEVHGLAEADEGPQHLPRHRPRLHPQRLLAQPLLGLGHQLLLDLHVGEISVESEAIRQWPASEISISLHFQHFNHPNKIETNTLPLPVGINSVELGDCILGFHVVYPGTEVFSARNTLDQGVKKIEFFFNDLRKKLEF